MPGRLAIHGGSRTVDEELPAYPQFGDDEKTAVAKLMRTDRISSWSLEGPVDELEAVARRYHSSAYALSFASGTAALHASLWAVGVRPGDRVMTPAYTWLSALTAILHAGATPIFCDVGADSVNLDARIILRTAMRYKPKALVVTHMWGIPADMQAIVSECRRLGVRVIEDCSHAHGASISGQKLGTFGDIGCFSMQNRKPVAAGEGGFAITNEHALLCRMMVLGHVGPRLGQELARMDDALPEKRYLCAFRDCSPAYKYRISLLSAAIGAVQLNDIDQKNDVRSLNYELFENSIDDRRGDLSWVRPAKGTSRGWYAVPAFLRKGARDARMTKFFVEACRAEGVPMRDSYPDWTSMPLFLDGSLRREFWANAGHELHCAPDGRPNEGSLRNQIVLFDMPSAPMPEAISKMGAAVTKVLDYLNSGASIDVPDLKLGLIR